ncbi:neuropeptides capa receptor-like [Leucoraja erinacea]|uniref:neuropeptides capa receptor-like n=1 Tax=Leucoraja erinaceus TaxID=7782 RepID=UPI002458FF32|nr:neuropeptides capa receptor-like [Leucoraja erinacea]
MAAADLLVIIFDLILRMIPIAHEMYFVKFIPLCNIHAVVLYAVTDCSVWITVAFTFDRFVAICCQKLKHRYCTDKTATVVLGTVSVLSSVKNVYWYFMYSSWYTLANTPWFCYMDVRVMFSVTWATIEFLHYILTPCVPFVLILLLNTLTIRHILVVSRARRRLRDQKSADPEMENRRKSMILLFIISGNFILLWAVFTFYLIWKRMRNLRYSDFFLPSFVSEIGFMLQILSCCTNTCIYAVTQKKFREQYLTVLIYPFTRLTRLIKHCTRIKAEKITVSMVRTVDL